VLQYDLSQKVPGSDRNWSHDLHLELITSPILENGWVTSTILMLRVDIAH
jgi:hypothetical protein